MGVALFIATLLAAVSAQNSTGYDITSTPFQLFLHGNANGTVDLCDVGANLRSLVCFCFYNNTSPSAPGTFNTFNFNSSADAQPPADRVNSSMPGILTWMRPVHNGQYPPIPHALYFQNNGFAGFGDDNASPVMLPDGPWRMTPQTIAFDDQNELVVPGSAENKKWYMCKQNFSGYQYIMLGYGVRKGKPDTTTCVDIGGIKRVFV